MQQAISWAFLVISRQIKLIEFLNLIKCVCVVRAFHFNIKYEIQTDASAGERGHHEAEKPKETKTLKIAQDN